MFLKIARYSTIIFEFLKINIVSLSTTNNIRLVNKL